MSALLVRNGRGYREASIAEIQGAAAELALESVRGKTLDKSQAAKEFIRQRLAGRDAECFAVLWLDGQLRVLDFEIIFMGTVDSTRVHPREILKSALRHNAENCIVAHSHPGEPIETLVPSDDDVRMTIALCAMLKMIDVKMLDHVIVGKSQAVSMDELRSIDFGKEHQIVTRSLDALMKRLVRGET